MTWRYAGRASAHQLGGAQGDDPDELERVGAYGPGLWQCLLAIAPGAPETVLDAVAFDAARLHSSVERP
jgi:hypothetical protein